MRNLQIYRSIDRKRRKKRPTKYKFRFVPLHMTIETDELFCPDQIQLVCMHRGRRVVSKIRQLESSCNIACRRLVEWPEQIADQLEFETTLYSRETIDTPDDKNWTLFVEGWMRVINNKNGKEKRFHKSLASTELNMKTLISQPGQQAEVHLVMRPLYPGVKLCQLDILVQTVYAEVDETAASLVSSTPGSVQSTPGQPYMISTPVAQIPLSQESLSLPPKNASKENGREKTTAKRQLNFNDDFAADAEEEEEEQQQPSSTAAVHNLQTDNSIIFESPPYTTPTAVQHQPPSPTKAFVRFAATQPQPVAHHHQRQLSLQQPPPPLQLLPAQQNGTGTTSTIMVMDLEQPAPTRALHSSAPPPLRRPQQQQPEKMNNHNNIVAAARPKPAPFRSQNKDWPSQDEVQKKIAQIIAAKRPDLTPKTSRPGAPANRSPMVRQTSVPSHFMEMGRNIQQELQQIARQVDEIEEQDQLVLSKISDYEKDSNEERELIEHHHRLVGEKDQLSRRQDYLNVQLELNDTEFKIEHMRSMLASGNGTAEEEQVDGPMAADSILRHHDSRRDSNTLLMELKELMDQKDELTHQLSNMEDEDEEGLERTRMTLERTRQQNFLRGQQEPLNVSRRLMSWISGVEQRFMQ